ncbi:MAG: YggT family protein [Pseudomonadota bacterium]
MAAFEYLFNAVIGLIIWVVIANVIMSWLIGFNVVNRHNRIVDMIWRTTVSVTEPLLGPIRRVLPSLGGLDLSPIVLIIGLQFLQIFINQNIFGRAYG